jgi:hypothetical protein
VKIFKYVQLSMLILSELLLGFAIYKAINMNNFVVVGTLGLPFLYLAYLGYGLKVKNFKGGGIEVNTDSENCEVKNDEAQ